MKTEVDEYSSRAGMYRLLAAFPERGADFGAALDRTLQDPNVRDTLTTLVGVAFACYVMKCDGDTPAAIALIEDELRTAEDLESLGG